ncbi:hypothetical protein Pd630_LPD11032 (plasmid) [Rhodococcus opacus PD630]|nr:hypothetical protein Pd630_LPD11032 [Rhodococcus opacus PD630]
MLQLGASGRQFRKFGSGQDCRPFCQPDVALNKNESYVAEL